MVGAPTLRGSEYAVFALRARLAAAGADEAVGADFEAGGVRGAWARLADGSGCPPVVAVAERASFAA